MDVGAQLRTAGITARSHLPSAMGSCRRGPRARRSWGLRDPAALLRPSPEMSLCRLPATRLYEPWQLLRLLPLALVLGRRLLGTTQLGDGLADALSLGLQLFQVRLELGGPLLAGSEAALEAVLLAPVVVGTAIASAAAIAAVVAAAGAVATVGVILVVTAAAPTPVFVAVVLATPAGLLALVVAVALTAPAAAAFALVMTLAHWCTSVAESSRVCYSPPAG